MRIEQGTTCPPDEKKARFVRGIPPCKLSLFSSDDATLRYFFFSSKRLSDHSPNLSPRKSLKTIVLNHTNIVAVESSLVPDLTRLTIHTYHRSHSQRSLEGTIGNFAVEFVILGPMQAVQRASSPSRRVAETKTVSAYPACWPAPRLTSRSHAVVFEVEVRAQRACRRYLPLPLPQN